MNQKILASAKVLLRGLYRLFRAAPLKTLLFRWSVHAPFSSVYLFPNVHFSAARTSRVVVDGRFRFGTRWERERYFASQLLLADRATVRVEGDFQFLSGCSVWVEGGATLSLGSGYMNDHGRVGCTKEVRIGNGVFIAPNVLI